MTTRLQPKMRIGIYAGTFDPVHKGHIAFALQSIRDAGLDKVLFIPEQKPRGKEGATHIGHRVAMLQRALVPYPRLAIRELPDKNFTISHSLARLNRLYPGVTLFRMIGSDVLPTMPHWPHIDAMLTNMGLIVGLRNNDTTATADAQLIALPKKPREVHIIATEHYIVSSSIIRLSISRRHSHAAMPGLIKRYVRENWLYVGTPERLLLPA